jgi:type VI secretion system protein ImpJ
VDYLQRVLWTEGLFLTPHHLQQVDRYHEYRQNTGIASIQPLCYGLREIQIDEGGLAEGNFALHKCKGAMPEGLLFDIPTNDEIPAARDVAAVFETGREKLSVYLAVPIARAGFAARAGEVDMEGIPPRFKAKEANIIDAMGLTPDRMVSVAMANLRILFEGESLDGHTWIQIAQIGRTATGGFSLIEDFVPPCTFIKASSHLMSVLRHILEILSTRSADLARQRRQRAEGLVDFTISEAATFWLLHTINGAIPPLLHCYSRGQVHPENLYLFLTQLAGQLYTFADVGHPKDVPPYNHDDLSGTFNKVQEVLEGLLGTVIPTHCVPVPLEHHPDGFYAGRVPDQKILKSGQFFLAVKSSSPDEKVVSEVPRKSKITSQDRIAHLTAQFLRGLELKYQPVPPKLIPVQPGFHYFELEKEGEHWEAVESSATIALYLPPEFSDLQLELIAIKE